LIVSSTAEQQIEKVLKIILPNSIFSGKAWAVGGYPRDQLLTEFFPGEIDPPKDLDVVVEMEDGAKKISEYLHDILKNNKGEAATHRPHLLGQGYPIWALHFLPDSDGNVKIEDKIFATSGGTIEFADTQKEAFPDPTTRQRITTYGTLEEDIKRRDFTVNMLLKDMTTGEIKDMTGTSKKDLQDGILRGHPDVDLVKIFSDDPLRMIRLIRFKVKYGWKIPEDVKKIVRDNIYRLNILSAERIRDELLKVIKFGKLKEAIELAYDLGLDKVELDSESGELNALSFLLQQLKPLEMRHNSPHHIDTDEKKDDRIIDHTMNVVDQAKKTTEMQLAALLHDIGKPKSRTEEDGKVTFKKHEIEGLEIAEEILKRFKLDSKTTKKILFLVENHMRPHQLEEASDKALRKFIREMGEDLEDVLDIAEADSLGKNPSKNYIPQLRKRISDLKSVEISSGNKPILNGKEIMDILKIKAGPQIGKVSSFLLDLQDGNPNLTKKEAEEAIKAEFLK
jgi:poly(A) polymerase